MFLHLNIRDWFTRSHPSKGENHIRNSSKTCKCKRAFRVNQHAEIVELSRECKYLRETERASTFRARKALQHEGSSPFLFQTSKVVLYFSGSCIKSRCLYSSLSTVTPRFYQEIVGPTFVITVPSTGSIHLYGCSRNFSNR